MWTDIQQQYLMPWLDDSSNCPVRGLFKEGWEELSPLLNASCFQPPSSISSLSRGFKNRKISDLYLTLWTPCVYVESPTTKPNCFLVQHYPPQAKLFSLQLNNQSTILFRRLPFALSFSFVRAMSEFIGTYSYQYNAIFTSLCVRSAFEIVSNLLFTHKKFCFKQVRYKNK